MKLLMISGDRSILQGKKGAFWYTLEELRKYWERVDVITPRIPGHRTQDQGRANENPFPNVFFHPSPHSLWKQSRWIVEKGRALHSEHQYDVMTAHEFPPFYNGMGACHLHQQIAVPYMLEVHHIVGWPRAASCLEWFGRIASRWQIPKSAYFASMVRTVNPDVKKILEKWGVPSSKIHILPSIYLDAGALTPDPSINKSYDLVFCARLVQNKGLSEVLRAVATLSNVTLLVIGDGPERQRMQSLARSLGIQDRVTFVGWLSTNTDVYRAMQSGKIFVMNSASEGGPRVLFEAMALGMPVITTSVGLVPEVITHKVNGMITNGSSADLAANITTVLSDENLRSRMGTSARAVLEKYDRTTLIREYADALKSLATPAHT